MAEIGSLAVSLSMDASNFNGTISQVDRNLRAMGSELQAVRAQGVEYGQSLEGLSQSQDILQRSLDASRLKLEQQRQKYDEMVASGTASEAAIERQANAVNRAQADYNRFQRQLGEVTEELERQRSVYTRVGSAIEELGNKTSKVGGQMKDMGGTLTTSVTTPLLALGTGALTVATQFDSAQARIQGQLGITAQEAEKLTQVAQDVWKKGFGEDIGQVTTDLSILKQYIKDVGDQELSKLLESGYTLQELFGADLQESARTASVMMQTFGIDGQTAMDLITVGFQRGGDFSGELLTTMQEYSPQFKALGYDAEAFTAILIAGAESGAFNLDKVGDAAKESFLRIGDGSKASRTALGDLGLDFKKIENDINSGGESANSAFAAVASAIALVQDPAEKSALAVALMGTPIEDLGPEFQNFFANVNTDLGNFEGAAQQAGETLQQSFGERLQSTWRTAQESLLPLGETLLDLAEDYLPKIISSVESATKWFTELSPSAQGTALAIGGIVAVAGPAIGILGMFASGIGGIASLAGPVIASLSGVGTGAGILGSALAAVTGPVGLTIAGVAAVGTAALVAGKELGESSIQVKDWSSKVSESTAEAVGGFLELSDQATVAVNEMAWGSTTVTQEMADNITGIYGQMGEQVLTAMQESHSTQLQTMTDYFSQSSALTENEEAEIIEAMKAKQAAKEITITEGQTRIAEIYNTAAQENRGTTEAEQQEINAIQEMMKNNAVQYMTESQAEQQVILETLKAEATRITAEQAAEVVKNSIKQREEVVTEAQAQYEKAVGEFIRQRDETGVISEEQANKLIEEAQRQRDETIKNAEETHEKVITEAKEQAEEHVNQVEWSTGEVKSKYEVMKEDLSKRMKEIGSDIKADWTQAYEDSITWVNNMADDISSSFQSMGENIGIKMNNAKDLIVAKWNEAETFLKNIDLAEIGRDVVEGLIIGINDKIEGVATAAKNLGSTLIKATSKVLDRNSPAKEISEIHIKLNRGSGSF